MLTPLWQKLANVSEVELVSPLARDECIRRLQAGMNAPMSVLALAEARPVIGRFRGPRLRARRRTSYRNSFAIHLSAQFTDESGQTRVSCRFSAHPPAVGFMIFWFAAVVVFAGTAIFALIASFASRRSQIQAGQWLGIVIPSLMITFGIGFVHFGRRLARDDREFLLNFLRQTVEARPV